MNNKLSEERLRNITQDLIQLARVSSWNEISDNCMYIITEDAGPAGNFTEQKAYIKKISLLPPKSLQEISVFLNQSYNDIYLLDFFIYKSLKSITLVEIKILYKSSLDDDYRETIINNPPMIHCKVLIPPYTHPFDKNTTQKKFDINWHHGTLRHKWHIFKLRLNYQLETFVKSLIQHI